MLEMQNWIILFLGALTIGANKAGLRGINMIIIPIFASYFGGKTSASTILPLLILGDCFSVWYYRSAVNWSSYRKLMPSALIGLAAGMIFGQAVPDRTFLFIMAVLILICLILMVYKEIAASALTLPDHWLAHGIAGITGGFSTMVGNAAGPIMSVYLLSMHLPKLTFIGTGAVFFMTVNVIKVPIQLLVWKSMTMETLKMSLILSPAVIIGFFLSLRLVRWIPERPFRIFIILGTLAGTIKLFLG